MKLKIGDLVEVGCSAIFEIYDILDDKDLNPSNFQYPIEGKCIYEGPDDPYEMIFAIGEIASWTIEGTYDISTVDKSWDIVKTFTKEKNPEYFL